VKRILGFLLLLAFLWFGGLVVFVSGLPARVEASDAHTDAIIVVTGGSERLAEGIRLLNRGVAKRLFVSGVNAGTHISDMIANLPPQAEKPSAKLIACCIEAGHAADSTLGNAAETAAWMQAGGLHSLRLVTGDYHMPRCLLEFRSAMPHIEIIPNPVFPDRLRRQGWWRSPGTANLLISEYDKYLIALLRIAIHGPAGTPAQGGS
jgi:uncharacterized SAM-binding protein YcdF (DUF218 family)